MAEPINLCQIREFFTDEELKVAKAKYKQLTEGMSLEERVAFCTGLCTAAYLLPYGVKISAELIGMLLAVGDYK